VTIRALTFGSAAEAYERYRPGYSDELVDLVLEAGPRDAVEIGAGTGRATRLLAARGVRITAVEPDPAMREVLRRTTDGLPVTIVASTLEELPAHPPVDLLYAAAAWHWTDPDGRWERAARLVREGGTFASFGSPVDLVDADLEAAVDRLRFEVTEPDPEHETDDDGMQWPGTELRGTPYFTDVRQDHQPVTYDVPADDYVGLLSTISAYLVLPEQERAALLGRIRGVLPDTVALRQDLWLHRATRTAVPVS
jgi:SAM-dependent methyltransferase